jgi:ethanolamine transporter EutH
MLSFFVASVDQVMLLEKRNKRYFKSVALGIQSGIILIPFEVFKEILIPFVKEIGWICYIFFNVILDVFTGVKNIATLSFKSIFYGFSGRLGLEDD